jgi:UDPglucose 6-dehydrogenase
MITVFGLWHLGCVTAACCAQHYKTIGLDLDEDRIQQLSEGRAPLLEPGLDPLLQEGLGSGNLRFSCNPKEALRDTKVLWVTLDTPVDDDDHADVDWVVGQLRAILPFLSPGTVVLISSQVPVNTTQALEREFASSGLLFAYSPENLRLGKALDIFRNPDRIVVGTRHPETRQVLSGILEKFSNNILWMSIESAEMTKHAINSFLALSVTFANELALLCEKTGANAHEVAEGLKSESRIGPLAYVSPGGAFAGGTLARDVLFLKQLGMLKQESLSVIPAILESNQKHKNWAFSKLEQSLRGLRDKKIGILGLTYKPHTSTLRRSNAMELALRLMSQGSRVIAWDPAVSASDPDLGAVQLATSPVDVFQAADAVVVMTEWREFRALDWTSLMPLMKQIIIVDQNRFCEAVIVSTNLKAQYYSVGVP